MKISILMPVYNEFRTFSQVLERVHQVPLPEGCSKETVVVDDGPTDGTTEIWAIASGKCPLLTTHGVLRRAKRFVPANARPPAPKAVSSTSRK